MWLASLLPLRYISSRSYACARKPDRKYAKHDRTLVCCARQAQEYDAHWAHPAQQVAAHVFQVQY